MLTMLLTVTLATGGISSAPQFNVQPCSTINGGFLDKRLEPQIAIEKARTEVWNAYLKHLDACIDLRLYSREGKVTNTIFRSGVRDGRWRAEITTGRSILREPHAHAPVYVEIRSVDRLDLSTGAKLTDDTQRNASDYKLQFRLNDDSVVEM